MNNRDVDRVTERMLRFVAWLAGALLVWKIWTSWGPDIAIFSALMLAGLIEACHMVWLHTRRNPTPPKGHPEMHRTDHD